MRIIVKLQSTSMAKLSTDYGFYMPEWKKKPVLYLTDKMIGKPVEFRVGNEIHHGKIKRINGKVHGLQDPVAFISVDDDVEHWTNDNDEIVPVNWSINYGDFKLKELVPTLLGDGIQEYLAYDYHKH